MTRKTKPGESAGLGESIRVIMTVTGDDARKLREFMEREGLPSPHAAMRAAALASLDDPAVGLSREVRMRMTHDMRTRLLAQLQHSFKVFCDEVEAELGIDRNVAATTEKEQVTFSREDQE